MNQADRIVGTLSELQHVTGSLTDLQHLDGTLDEFGAYGGSFNIIPSEQEQVLHTSGTMVTGNITVAPIPSNYALVTWNGRILTFS